MAFELAHVVLSHPEVLKVENPPDSATSSTSIGDTLNQVKKEMQERLAEKILERASEATSIDIDYKFETRYIQLNEIHWLEDSIVNRQNM